MDMDLTQLIGTVGLPGALAFALLYQLGTLKKSYDDNTKVLYQIAGLLRLAPKGDTESNG